MKPNTNLTSNTIRIPTSTPETAAVIQNINNVHVQREAPHVETRCQTIIPPPQFGYTWIPSDVYNYRPSFRYQYDYQPSYPIYAPVYRSALPPYPQCGNPYYQYCYRP
jgi:hypothetical protein